MKVSAARVGAALGEARFEMSPRAMLAYAAGLGLSDECYLDDARPGGAAMFPVMCASVEWPLADGGRLAELLGVSHADYRAVSVHAAQDTRFHRAPRMGETLLTRGRLLALRQTRAGVLASCGYETLGADGAAVFDSVSRAMLRGWEIDGAPEAGEAPAEPGAPPPGEGAAVEAIATARELPHVYSEAARIWNPIHTERRVALAAGLPDIILHGTASWALALDRVIRAHAGGDPGRVRRSACRFSGMAIPGETLELRHAAGGGAVGFELRGASGGVVLSGGLAEIAPG